MLRGKITLASKGHELPLPACSWRRMPGAVFLIGLWFVYITVLPVSLSLVLGNHSAAILLKGLIVILGVSTLSLKFHTVTGKTVLAGYLIG